MSNWCNTVYYVTGKKEDLDKIEEALSYMQKTPEKEKTGLDPEADTMWEGNVIILLGGDPFKNKEWYMRGFITCWDREEDGYLKLWADEADEVTDFRFALSELLKVKIYFETEEIEPKVFQTNDKEGKWFSERYIFIPSDDGDPDYLEEDDDPEKYMVDDPDGELLRVTFVEN